MTGAMAGLKVLGDVLRKIRGNIRNPHTSDHNIRGDVRNNRFNDIGCREMTLHGNHNCINDMRYRLGRIPSRLQCEQ